MILHNMEKVGRRHLEKIGVIVLAAASRFWHCESRMEESKITDSLGPSVPFYLITVDVQDLFKAEEQRRQ